MCAEKGKRGMTGKHGNQRRGRRVDYVSVTCRVCGAVREYPPGEVKRRGNILFCSNACKWASQRDESAHVRVVCDTCGVDFEKDRHRVKSKNYCSKKCSSIGIGKIHLEKIYGTSDVVARWKSPDLIKEYARTYASKNRERINRLSVEWGKRNRPKKNANMRARRGSGGSVSHSQWIEICNKYENLCVCCLRKEKLTFDHVIPVSKGGRTDVDNAQPLCSKCNQSKGAKVIDFRIDFEDRLRAGKP